MLINVLTVFLAVIIGEFFLLSAECKFLKDGSVKEKLRLCIVESKGAYRKTEKYCPILEQNSNIECVVGVDRLDCVRRINKGQAHFGVFSSEDLVAARWAGSEILVTNELRFNSEPFEYQVVAIVDNEANINTAADLRGSKFCHPGKGLENHWTDILADYFESTLVARGCENDLTLIESKIKASSKFFGPSCKAGPWVSDPVQDRIFKNRYPSLCELCYNPLHCGVGDKHWGRKGPLYCLTSGAGEVAWVRLDDAKSHFGFSGLPAESDPNSFSYLCADGHLQPLTTKYPCIWVEKPWPVIAATRSHSQQIQDFFATISRDSEWQSSLLMLLETYHVKITTLDNSIPIDDYLDQSVGFQSAYSFPSCNPPRSIIYCTTNLIQFAKCSWLQEASSVYGIEPNLQCIRTEHMYRCLDDTAHNVADVVLVDQDSRLVAERDFNLTTILHEFSPELSNNYVTVAVVKADSNIKSFEDLRGKSACFPSFEGAAQVSVLETLYQLNITANKCLSTVKHFFSPKSCTWDPKKGGDCPVSFKNDKGALRCLSEGRDVAFMSLDVYNNMTKGQSTEKWIKKLTNNQFRLLCPFKNTAKKSEKDGCYLNWTPRGNIMIHKNTNPLRKGEILNSLKTMDKLFGKHYKAHTIPFTLFGPFDKKNNVIFRDSTDSLKSKNDLSKVKLERNLEEIYESMSMEVCIDNSSSNIKSSFVVLIVGLVHLLMYYQDL